MIFVTVGMHNQGFDRLIKKCDLIAGETDEKMIMQKGCTSYCPENAESFDFASYEEILSLIRRSRVVITHDGAGSILNCLLNKKITVVVPRLKEFNECKYENKLDLALELEKQNKIHLIRDIDLLNLKLIEDLTTIGMMGDSKAIGRMEDSKAIGMMEDSKTIENFESKNNLLINIKKYIKI